MPMGARCAPKFFQRCAEFLAAPMDQTPGITIAGATADAATLCYMDDITLVTRGSFEFHIAYIGQFLDKLIHHGFTLNLDKCRSYGWPYGRSCGRVADTFLCRQGG